MTNQEIFDKVYKHLITQNARSRGYDRSGLIGCAYRGAGGRQCAVGCLIPDERYAFQLEGKGASHPHVLQAIGLLDTTAQTENLLDTLQRVHDTRTPDTWPEALAQVAVQCGLTVPALGDVP